MQKIGFTTGSLYKQNIDFCEAVKNYYSFGADAIELSFAEPAEFLDFELLPDLLKEIKRYDYISIHVPWKEVRYGKNKETQKLVDKLRKFSESLNVAGIVLHPDVTDNFSFLENTGLPFLLENMDKRKNFGINIGDFERLKDNYGFNFVLDVHHAYEHDNSMGLCYDLIEVMGLRLSEIHLSGADSENHHHPVYSSENKEKIINILNLNLKAPKILEGVLSDNFREEIPEELKFVRSYEK